MTFRKFLTLFLSIVAVNSSRRYHNSRRSSSKPVYQAEAELYDLLLTNYNSKARPVLSDEPVRVDMDLSLVQLIHLNEIDQQMTAHIWVRQRWNDMRLDWSKNYRYRNIETLRLYPEDIWTPDIHLYNAATANAEEEERVVPMLVYKNGTIDLTRLMVTTSTCEMHLKYFPFDVQRCFLKFGSWTNSKDRIDLRPIRKKINLSEYIENNMWKLLANPVTRNERNEEKKHNNDDEEDHSDGDDDHNTEQNDENDEDHHDDFDDYEFQPALNEHEGSGLAEKIEIELNLNHNITGNETDILVREVAQEGELRDLHLTFNMIFERDPRKYFINIIVPCLVFGILCVLSFYLPPTGDRMSLTLSVLVSISVFQVLVLDMIPEASNTQPVLILFLTALIIICFVSIIFSAIIIRVHNLVGDDPSGLESLYVSDGFFRYAHALSPYFLRDMNEEILEELFNDHVEILYMNFRITGKRQTDCALKKCLEVRPGCTSPPIGQTIIKIEMEAEEEQISSANVSRKSGPVRQSTFDSGRLSQSFTDTGNSNINTRSNKESSRESPKEIDRLLLSPVIGGRGDQQSPVSCSNSRRASLFHEEGISKEEKDKYLKLLDREWKFIARFLNSIGLIVYVATAVCILIWFFRHCFMTDEQVEHLIDECFDDGAHRAEKSHGH